MYGGGGSPHPPVLWVVVPCYNEEEVLPETAKRLSEKLARLVGSGHVAPSSRVLLVDDGSSDATWELVRSLHEGRAGEPPVPAGLFCGLRLSHNAGHQNALFAGLMHALDRGCDCAVSLDADLQDDIGAIDEMLARHAEGAEVVYGVRDNRDTDTRFKRGTAEAFYSLMGRLGVEMVPDSADYRLMGRRSLEALSGYGEANLFLRGIVPQLGFETARVHYRRGERFAGESKYPLSKMVSFALRGITSFSVAPIRLVTLIGALSVLVSVAMVVYALVSAVLGTVVPGWTSLMVSVWLVGGLVMISLGVVGEYVGQTYLESKHRPRYIVGEVLD